MADQEEHQQPAQDDRPKRTKKKKSSASKKKVPQKQAAVTPPAPPAERPEGRVKRTLYDRQQVDYVRTATAGNVWYYRDRSTCPDDTRSCSFMGVLAC